MSIPIHDRTIKAKGCGLLNHFTITADYQRPTNITKPLAIEGALSSTNYILIESDGFGFGIFCMNYLGMRMIIGYRSISL